MEKRMRLAAILLAGFFASPVMAQVAVQPEQPGRAGAAAEPRRVGAQILQLQAADGVAPGQPGTFIFAAQRMEVSAYLGITVAQATPAVREQLKLEKGVGLIV